jgi:hypothetical protein
VANEPHKASILKMIRREHHKSPNGQVLFEGNQPLMPTAGRDFHCQKENE